MLAGLPPTLLANAGAVGILGVAVLGILRGWLVPGRSMDRLLGVHAERLAEEKGRGNEWKAAYEAAVKRADERDRQTEQLLRVTNATVAAMEALTKAAEAKAGEGS